MDLKDSESVTSQLGVIGGCGVLNDHELTGRGSVFK